MDARTTTRSPDSFANVAPLAVWTLGWVATLAIARFVPGLLGEWGTVATWVALGLNVVAGIVWMIAHARYLHRVDDLQRKILMDALAIALGAGIVGGCAIAIAEDAGLVGLTADIGLLSVLMAVVYAVATAVGTVRYR